MLESRHRLNNKVSASGCILCAYFRILYAIPLGPRVEEFKAVDRVRVTSLEKIGFHVLGGHGGGSVSWMGSTGLGASGKKQALKKSAFSLGMLPSSRATFLRRGEGVRSLSMMDTGHVLDVLGIYCLVQLFMCPFLLCLCDGVVKGLSGFVSFISVLCESSPCLGSYADFIPLGGTV